MTNAPPDVATTRFILPPDARFLAVSELSGRLRTRIGPVDVGQAVITRPGFRVTTRLVPGPLADLIGEFRAPSLITDAVLRFSRAHDQEPNEMLELAFDAIATLVETRILVPAGSPDANATAPSLAAGQEFDGFEIEALIRSLEDSEVYRARGPDAVSVALKIARDDRPGIIAMMAHEARVLDRLGGDDSPRLLHHGSVNGRVYVAMEWCDGVSIATAAQQARAARDPRRLQKIVSDLFAAYGRLHHMGVLHGDIHPGNCLVRDDGRVVLLDFGNARSTAAHDVVDPLRSGIPQFHDPQMAAALLAGELPPAATPKSEQYAIAVLGYLLLTGLPPINAPAIHDELLRNIVCRPMLPFAARGIPAWPTGEAVLRRALSKEPAHRFLDVSVMAEAFSSAVLPTDTSTPWPPATQRAFDESVADVRALARNTDPAAQAWFALRAAVALEDAELLAAADILIAGAQRGWRSLATAVQVARARSDVRAETLAITRLMTTADKLRDGPEAAVALLAAARLLHGDASRASNILELASWAEQRLDHLLHASAARYDAVRSTEATLVRVALTLAVSGTVAVRDDLVARIEALRENRAGDVWLWATAYDMYGDEQFRRSALAARLPRNPLPRVFALLRRHQLTGDLRWVADARRVVVAAATSAPRRVSALEMALLMVEISAPERAVMPL